MTEDPAGDSVVGEEHSPADLTDAEQRQVDSRKPAPARIVHEIVRQYGVEELKRPLASLIWSGFAAGVSIWLSLIAEAALELNLPDTPWRPMLADLGYSVGFIVVILGRLQLFTESTITALIPLAARPSWASLVRTGRLWLAVFLANIGGTLAVAWLMPRSAIMTPAQVTAMLEIAQPLLALTPGEAFARGIPAGFILATIAWVLPSVKGQEIWVIGLLTWIVSLAGFSHVIAGSAEAWLLATTGQASYGFALFGFILPAMAGNMVGGTGLFAVLAHAQVRSEL